MTSCVGLCGRFLLFCCCCVLSPDIWQWVIFPLYHLCTSVHLLAVISIHWSWKCLVVIPYIPYHTKSANIANSDFWFVLLECRWYVLALFCFRVNVSSTLLPMYIQILHKYGKLNGVSYLVFFYGFTMDRHGSRLVSTWNISQTTFFGGSIPLLFLKLKY